MGHVHHRSVTTVVVGVPVGVGITVDDEVGPSVLAVIVVGESVDSDRPVGAVDQSGDGFLLVGRIEGKLLTAVAGSERHAGTLVDEGTGLEFLAVRLERTRQILVADGHLAVALRHRHLSTDFGDRTD